MEEKPVPSINAFKNLTQKAMHRGEIKRASIPDTCEYSHVLGWLVCWTKN